MNWLPLGTANTRWDIALNPQMPLALQINGGLGRANLDLEALNVTTLNLDVGVGTIQVTGPKSGATAMRINGGVGNVIVRVPTGVAGRSRVSNGIGSIRVDESRFPKFGSTFASSDYAAATNRIDIDIDGGVGNIEVR
jgi:predicted membrane protein